MITPADIENKDFTRSKKGYNEDEVDEFLDLIIVDMEKLIRENKQLKSELEKAHSQVDKHMSTETSVYETLEAAKSLMNDIAASAERRAEILLKNAELEAALITRDAKESITKYSDEGLRMKQRFDKMRDRYRQMLEAELERVEVAQEDIFTEFEEDFLPASMTNLGLKEETKAEAKIAKATAHTVVMDKFDEQNLEPMDMTKTMVNIR